MNVFITYHLKSQLILFVIQIIIFGLLFRKIWLELKSYIFKSTRISIWEFQSLWMLSVRRQVYSKNPIQADISQDSATTKSEIDDFNASDNTGM